jgi:glycerol-3-phosphate O-acyltransferase/dihydroxyacetone phosphate acyltransferase
MAESVSLKQSYKKKVIGFFGRLLHAIPVKRPQDYVTKGSGLVTSDGSGRVTGRNSKFSKEIHPGDTLKAAGLELLVKSVESDELLTTSPVSSPFKDVEFKIVPKIDQSKIYEAVHSELKRGRCIGIFPEGGSHDRSTNLPLKAGVCLMALGAMAKFNITVTIQCIGLNYYQGHRFRSKAVLNFGVPYLIPRELATLYMQNRKQAIEILLNQIEKVRSK